MIKKEKKHKEFKDILLAFKKKEKQGVPVRIKEENHYAVLEPINSSKQNKEISQPKKELIKEEIKPKTEEVKPIIVTESILQKEVKTEPTQKEVLIKNKEKTTELEESVSRIPTNHIETDIDRLMKIIDEKKVVGIDEISKILKISPDRLENWAKLLEDRGLVEIEYPILGLPKLRKKEWKKKY